MKKNNPKKIIYLQGGLQLNKIHKELDMHNICIKNINDIYEIYNSDDENLKLVILSSSFYKKNKTKIEDLHNKNSLIMLSCEDRAKLNGLDTGNIYDFVEIPINKIKLNLKVKNAFDKLSSQVQIENLKKTLNERDRELNDISRIGIAISAEKDLNKLLELILYKTREITFSDAGSLYLVEKGERKKHLTFKLTHNNTLDLKFDEFTIPISKKSIAGYVALTGETINIEDAYKISKDKPYQFNKSFDERNKYRTKSMIVIPLKNHKDEIIGVIQLINKKKDRNIKLTNNRIIKEYIIPYNKEDEHTLLSLGSLAAISIENNLLYQNIKDLFEGFVKASVTAIESRDPTTSGHSERVAILTEQLALTINKIKTGKFKNIYFSENQLKEIRYASLLHDMGKVGVREEVLLKAKKLYKKDLEIIKQRFNFIKLKTINKYINNKLEFLLKKGKQEYLKRLDDFENKLKKELNNLDFYLETIIKANEPSVLKSESQTLISEISEKTYQDLDGKEKRYLDDKEKNNLLILKGSLNKEERKEVESHIIKTIKFLRKVPWTKEISDIPKVAYYHHERLDGSGYPEKITDQKIPIQSKMMAIADIFDSLTAWDRPYKSAMPYEKALNILKYEVKDQHLDKDLVDIFIKSEIYKLVMKKDHKRKTVRTY